MAHKEAHGEGQSKEYGMTLTEEEAKTKRCQESYGPPATSTQFAYAIGVSVAAHTAPLNCIGSDCMAWRWDSDSMWVGPPQAIKRADRNEWKGYCGKAGQP